MSDSSIVVRSFAKINLGLKVGRSRPDGFHELRTVYQTIALHDVVHVDGQPGSGIEIRCDDSRVPLDQANTCYRITDRVLRALPQGLKPLPGESLHGAAKAAPLQNQSGGTVEAVPFQSAAHHDTAEAVPFQGKVVIQIDKRLPVQGGLGAASSNAVATMFGVERALGIKLAADDELRIAAEVGSDLPLFLVGGTVLGAGRGEQVYPLPELPTTHLVVVTPPVGVSTPAAFARWDEMAAREPELTGANRAGTINKLGQGRFAWPNEFFSQVLPASKPASGVPATGPLAGPAFGLDRVKVGGDQAETLLLDLVRTGIENDFERVVFPEYPELREVKLVLEREGAQYASLSGSGSALYGLFASGEEAQSAAERMTAAGHVAIATTTLTRDEYWRQMFEST